MQIGAGFRRTSGDHREPVVHAAATMPPRVLNRRIIGNLTPENRSFSGASGQTHAGRPGREQKSPPPSSLPGSDCRVRDR